MTTRNTALTAKAARRIVENIGTADNLRHSLIAELEAALGRLKAAYQAIDAGEPLRDRLGKNIADLERGLAEAQLLGLGLASATGSAHIIYETAVNDEQY